MIPRCLFVCVVLAPFVNGGIIGRTQSIAAIGRLFCNGNFTLEPIKVQLIDRDYGSADDVMGEVYTESHGSFYVSGSEKEISPIDPELRFFHKCGEDETEKCSKIEIPDEFIFSNPSEAKIYDAGTLFLENITEKC